MIGRAQQGAEQLLGAAGLSAENRGRVVETIMGDSTADAAKLSEGDRPASPPAPPSNPPAPAAALATPSPPPVQEPAPEPAAETEEPPDQAG